MKKRFAIIWSVILIVLVLALLWGSLFYYSDCSSEACFQDKMSECRKAKFTSIGQMSFEERIEGRSGDSCIVSVKLLRGDLSDLDSVKLEGKEMRCEIPFGVVLKPESNIADCHGLLKEGLQDLIIARQHKYLVQNVGDINFGLI
jgi:hypothetical protein